MDGRVRDIDDWMFHFERQVAVRLRKMLSIDSRELPESLAQRLQKLAEADRKDESHNSEQKPFQK